MAMARLISVNYSQLDQDIQYILGACSKLLQCTNIACRS